MPTPRRIVLLGATGSIGESTLKVIRQHPDRLELVGDRRWPPEGSARRHCERVWCARDQPL